MSHAESRNFQEGVRTRGWKARKRKRKRKERENQLPALSGLAGHGAQHQCLQPSLPSGDGLWWQCAVVERRENGFAIGLRL